MSEIFRFAATRPPFPSKGIALPPKPYLPIGLRSKSERKAALAKLKKTVEGERGALEKIEAKWADLASELPRSASPEAVAKKIDARQERVADSELEIVERALFLAHRTRTDPRELARLSALYKVLDRRRDPKGPLERLSSPIALPAVVPSPDAGAPQVAVPKKPTLQTRCAAVAIEIRMAHTTVSKRDPEGTTRAAIRFEHALSAETLALLAGLQVDPSLSKTRLLDALARAMKARGATANVDNPDTPDERNHAWSSDDDWGPDTGPFRPSGIADLMIVREHVARYVGGELAHIETIMRGETRQREHRQFARDEEVVVTDQERTTTEERDLQTTDRFEMRSETAKTLTLDAKLKAGASFSAAYGPFVQVKAYVDGEVATNITEAQKRATEFSREVISRSAAKIADRARTTIERRTIRELEEKNLHRFENDSDSTAVNGIYQWLTKVNAAQVFSYGKRMMFDVMIPEPAKIYRHLSNKLLDSATRSAPPPLTVTPTELWEGNYQEVAGAYGVEVDPPPPPDMWIAKSIADKLPPPPPPDENGEQPAMPKAGSFSATHEFVIPTGWMAVGLECSAIFSWTIEGSYDDQGKWIIDEDAETEAKKYRRVQLACGDLTFGWDDTTGTHMYASFGAADPTSAYAFRQGAVPVAISALNVASYSVAMSVYLWPSPQKYQEWQIKTFAAIKDAYETKLAAYAEWVTTNSVGGATPLEAGLASGPEVFVRTELKRAAVELLAGWYGEGGTVYLPSSGDGHPEMSHLLHRYLGPFVRFVEEAFEWEHLSYVMHPYFWINRDEWASLFSNLGRQSGIVANFLSAGWARVNLPVTPGFEAAVSYFLETRIPWNGEGEPPVQSGLYCNIVDEIAEEKGRPSGEKPVGDAWTYEIPTTLVWLRPKEDLPHWHQLKDASWAELSKKSPKP